MKDPHLDQVLGPYRLRRVVGRGGMGTVYGATDVNTGEVCAVKLLSPALAVDPAFRERFSAEIESLKKLHHPHIVQLYGYGEQDGQLFYSMELIEGSSLQEELRHGRRFSWRDVVAIAVDVCAALKHAHDHGVVHRDLKPANLLYTSDEKVKLLDFGIAKLFGNTNLTTGSVMGTADYMAPEQAEGQPVGPRTDLYSLGSVMYALLTGRPPFVGKSLPEVVHRVRFEPPIPVGRIAADVPVELDQLIGQLLEKNPQKRIPTALATSHRLKAMEHALSVRREPSDDIADPLTPVAKSSNSGRHDADPNQQETVRLDHRQQGDEAVKQLTVTSQEAVVGVGPDHFTMVDAEVDITHPDRSRWQLVPLAIVLVAIVWGVYQGIRWASRPASADDLYAQIQERAAGDTARDLALVEPQMELFLSNYADDPRASEIAALHSRLALDRLQRRLDEKARRRSRPVESPIEELYLDIVPLIGTQPDLADQRLRAFVDLLTTLNHADDVPEQFLQLARYQLEQLTAQQARQSQAHGPLIDQQMATARELAMTDPDRARRIYHGLIELYGDKSWASETISAARRELESLAPEPSVVAD